MIDNKLVIAIDFDGTIVEESYPQLGKLRKGAKKYINKLYDDGHIIIINTCRSGVHQNAAFKMLIGLDVSFDLMNENHPSVIAQYHNDSRKISADLYIDDKNLVKLPSWKEKYKLIKKHYKRIKHNER
jgi:predicted mannosyl-3-phosphoglycerate phosphatase (HAD superfamily)